MGYSEKSHPFNRHDTIKSSRTLKKLIPIVVLLLLVSLHSLSDKTGFNFTGQIGVIKSKESSEIFEVTLPHLDFGEPVYHQHLLSHVFSDSWGKPAIETYSAPPSNISFNKVILTLNTQVDGVQYDRLAHVYLDGIALWRTSTIEPGGRSVWSVASKDVSIYTKLFQKNDISLMLQLDNLVTKRLTGLFNTSLEATYYKAPENISIVPKDYDDELSSPGSIKSFFGNSDPADQVWSIVSQPSSNRPPLVYQPGNELKAVLPKFNANTTRAKVELFLSGNAAEEFWYSNVLSGYTDLFPDHPLLGHGPCRVADIYLDDQKIASLMPELIIYTGGISPLLWRPIVASGAFDVRALEVELTPLLPLLWEDLRTLSIQINNCDAKGDSRIGENWITTANILTWESSKVASSGGAFLGTFNHTSYTTVLIGGKGSLTFNQIVSSKLKTYIQGQLNYTLHNGSSVNVVSDVLTSYTLGNVQLYAHKGDTQTVSHESVSHHSFSLTDVDSSSLISQTNITHLFPMFIHLNSKNDGREATYDVVIARDALASVKFSGSGEDSITLDSRQNGTSTYVLSPSGNHGTGKTEHRFKARTRDPLPLASFKRHVFAEDGKVVHDHKKYKAAPSDSESGSVVAVGDEDFQLTVEAMNVLLQDGYLNAELCDLTTDRLARTLSEEHNGNYSPVPWSEIKMSRGMILY